MQTFIHYFFHLGVPLIIAVGFFRDRWKSTYFILLATMLVDLDHLLASPVFQPNRCSIGLHFLHTGYAIVGYGVLLFLKRPYYIIGLGLLLHMLTDFVDCLIMYDACRACYSNAPAVKLLRATANFLGM